MKLRIRTIWITILVAVLAVCSSYGSEQGRISLSGKLLEISFVSPLPTYHEKKSFSPTHSWQSGEQFEFGMNDKHGPVYVRVGVKKVSTPNQIDPEETLQTVLKEKREVYTHPTGKVIRTVKLGEQNVPIMSFHQVAGDQTEATVYSDGFSISFYLMQENSYNRGGYGDCMEQIVKSLHVQKK